MHLKIPYFRLYLNWCLGVDVLQFGFYLHFVLSFSLQILYGRPSLISSLSTIELLGSSLLVYLSL